MKPIYFALAMSAALVGTFAPAARADEWNKQVTITFNEPVEVPGKVLPPGTYQFKLGEGETDDRRVVEIYNDKLTHLETTVMAIPDQRLKAQGEKHVIQFDERPAGSPQAIRAFFYPGGKYGLQFVYPHERARELAKSNRQAVYSSQSDLSDRKNWKKSQIKTMQPDGTENDINTNDSQNPR